MVQLLANQLLVIYIIGLVSDISLNLLARIRIKNNPLVSLKDYWDTYGIGLAAHIVAFILLIAGFFVFPIYNSISNDKSYALSMLYLFLITMPIGMGMDYFMNKSNMFPELKKWYKVHSPLSSAIWGGLALYFATFVVINLEIFVNNNPII